MQQLSRGRAGADRCTGRGAATSWRRLLFAGALLVGGAACQREQAPAASPAPPPATQPGPRPLAFVEGLVGRYPREVRLFETPPLSTRIETLLGERYALLGSNLEVQGPISEEKGLVYVTGNKQHAGGSDAAIVLIDVPDDALQVWLLVGGEIQEVREKALDRPLPDDVRSLLASWRERP